MSKKTLTGDKSYLSVSK